MIAWWIIALLPVGLGLVLVAVMALGWLGNPTVHLHVDLGTLSFIVGLLLSGPALLLLRIFLQHRQHREELGWVEERMNIARQRFLQRLDHELKNPLTAILNGLANLLSGPADDTELNILRTMQAQALRTRRITADLRKLAQLETLELNLAPVNVNELLQQVVELTREQPEARERRLTLTLPKISWPLSMASADRELLLTAISNLLDNALKFTHPGDAIDVHAFEVEGYLQIEVTDSGPGIPEEDLPHLGKQLFRGKNAAGVPGSGIGLALTDAIIKRHDGQMNIRSHLGEGTIVTIRLPLNRV